MAKYHGKSLFCTVADSGGTARKISGDSTSVTINREASTGETTGFGDTDQTHVVGIRGYTVAIEGLWSDTADTGTYIVLNGIIGASTTWVVAPAGSATGMVKLSGSGFCTSFNTTGPVGGVVTFSANIQGTGALSASTY
jgi:hypothetical protein